MQVLIAMALEHLSLQLLQAYEERLQKQEDEKRKKASGV
jgi:hypothetical protein